MPHGVSLFLVPRDAKGLTVTGYPTQIRRARGRS